jgi:succinate dehydrogenase / fumarate reductase cytochrome b subunit
MAVALTKENYVLHKLHSLTGIVPVGFYMVQHLSLNSFSLGGAAKFNGVIDFFEAMPKHILLTLEIFVIWIPLAFHSIYGLFITGRAKSNFIGTKYGWSENRMYWLQRVTGVFLFFFLIYHIISTTVRKYVVNDADVIKYAAWNEKLSANGYLLTWVYMLGVLAASYHLAYGIWNFCIRWGITVSDDAQVRVQKFSLGAFIALTGLGWAALAGFLIGKPEAKAEPQVEVSAPFPSRVG